MTTGGVVTINADPTKIDIAAGTGFIQNWSSPSAPTFISYSWDAQIGVDIPDLTLGFTDICMVASATPNIAEPLLTSGVEATPALKRTAIQLQSALHLNLTSVNIIGNSSIPSYQQINSALDYIHRLGVINVANNYLENGANLQINKTTGESVFPFINRSNDPTNPTELTNTATISVNMVKEYRDGVGGYTLAISTDIDPDFWDDGTGTLNSVGNNNYTIKRFYFFGQTNTTIVTYGQAEYNTFILAEAAIISENPILDPILHDASFTTALIVQQGSTDLEAEILAGDAEFVNITDSLSTGGVGGGAVGSFITQDTDQLTGNTGDKVIDGDWKYNTDLRVVYGKKIILDADDDEHAYIFYDKLNSLGYGSGVIY